MSLTLERPKQTHSLCRIHLDRNGYEIGTAHYYGAGLPLYAVENLATGAYFLQRATDRNAAKQLAWRYNPEMVFGR